LLLSLDGRKDVASLKLH